MKTVLLAVDHIIPDKKALDYTLTLCRRLLAGLDVLHIIQVKGATKSRDYLDTLRSGARYARDLFETAMVTATFAEAGLPEGEKTLKAKAFDQFKHILPESESDRVDYHCVVTGEAADTVIERYVRNHRNVILTVFDSQSDMSAPPADKKKSGGTGRRLMPRLAVPLVLVKNGS